MAKTARPSEFGARVKQPAKGGTSGDYVPHRRYFVLRPDGLEYYRLFLAGADGGDTVTSGEGRKLPFSAMQARAAAATSSQMSSAYSPGSRETGGDG